MARTPNKASIAWPADKVERRPIETLIPYARNARTHSDEQIAQIAASISEWGWTIPVLVDENGGIIAGHGRVLAARKLGIEEIPVMVASGWTEAQKRAYLIADNRIPMSAGWDFDALRDELTWLREEDFNILDVGFSFQELDAIFSPVAKKDGGDPDHIPDTAPTRCEIGNVFRLGRHTLVCGDSSSDAVIATALGGREPDVVIYDPPYDVDEAWTWMYRAPRALVFCDYRRILAAASCLAGYEHVYEFIWDGVTSWYTPNKPLARHKSCYYGSADGAWQFDAAIYHDGKKRQAKTVTNTRGSSDYEPLAGGAVHLSTLFQQPNTKTDGGHAHAKPVKWVRALMKGTGGRIFLDQFVGSGTSFVAAADDATVCGIELNPETCDIAIARWEEFTGETAVKVEASAAIVDRRAVRRPSREDRSLGLP